MKRIILVSTAFISFGTLSLLYGMKRKHETPLHIQTADGEIIETKKEIALEIPFIKNAIKWQKDTPRPINLSDYSSATIELIFSIFENIYNTKKTKRQDGEYIAQNIQPIIDTALQNKSIETINALIAACNFLELPALVNGAIRVVTQKMLNDNPSIDYRDILQSYTNQFGPLPEDYEALYEKQYYLIKDGNIPELSVADYIAINGKPEIKKSRYDSLLFLDLFKKELTSLEGLKQINNITTVQEIFLGLNKLRKLPVKIFNGLSQLQKISIANNKLNFLPAGIFKGLIHLKSIDLFNNQLPSLPSTVFNDLAQLKYLGLGENKLNQLPKEIFKNLTQLELLDLHDNELKKLPAGIFDSLSQLERIYLYNNQLNLTAEQIKTDNPKLPQEVMLFLGN